MQMVGLDGEAGINDFVSSLTHDLRTPLTRLRGTAEMALRESSDPEALREALADCVLVPQIFNARRVDCRLDHVPTVMRVFDACMAEPAFASTQPSACPDAT